MLHIISMEDLVSKVASQKRKNNFFELSENEQFKICVDVFNGMVENFTYGDSCIIIHSTHQHIFKNSLKKDYFNSSMVSKETIFEKKYGLELSNEKTNFFNKLKNILSNNKSFVFLDTSNLKLIELEVAYGLSKLLDKSNTIIYSNEEYTYQIKDCQVNNYLKGTQSLRNLYEMEIRLSFLGSFKLGISNCLPEYTYNDKKYSVQFGDKTISKIYDEIDFSLFQTKDFLEVTLPILYKFTVEKFRIKLQDDEIDEDIIKEELNTLEFIIEHNLKQNIKLLDINRRIDSYEIELKTIVKSFPSTFTSKHKEIPILNKEIFNF